MLGTPRCSDIAYDARDSWCSDIASDAEDSSVLRHHQRRRGLLGARTSPATVGTPWCSDIASYAGDSSVLGRRQLCQGLPWWLDLATSHRCAIKLLYAVRIRVLILGSTSGVLICACQTTSTSFQTSFSLTLLQDSFFIFQQA